MNIPYDEMSEKIEELIVEVERLESENKHLLDLQKNMDKQYEELEKENQQLKEENNITKEHHQEMVNYAYDLMVKRDKYKSVLDEIREYIENHKIVNLDEFEYITTSPKVMLQILDKVKNESKRDV